MTRILGIDPGTNITGLGIIETNGSAINYIYHEILKTGIKNKHSIKLASIHMAVNKIIIGCALNIKATPIKEPIINANNEIVTPKNISNLAL